MRLAADSVDHEYRTGKRKNLRLDRWEMKRTWKILVSTLL